MSGADYALPTQSSNTEKYLAEIVKLYSSSGGGNSGGGGEIPDDLLQRLERLEATMNPQPESNMNYVIDPYSFRDNNFFLVTDNAHPWTASSEHSSISLASGAKGINSVSSTTTIEFSTHNVSNRLSFEIYGQSEGSDRVTVSLLNLTNNATTTIISGVGGNTFYNKWTYYEITIPQGAMRLTLNYSKDGSVHTGLDGYWIRNLTIKGKMG